MDSLGILAFTMATSAFGIAIVGLIYVHGRLNNLERKLKEFDELRARPERGPHVADAGAE